jgi:outer membrane lipase/esterase
MRKMLLLKLALLILIQWPFAAHALLYSNLYVFGDSLSDQGNDSLITNGAVPPAEYTDGTTSGRFTDGRNYVDYLSQSLGLTVAPSLLGGTNYAYGGARTNSQVLPSPPAMSLLQQRDAYLGSLGGGHADANALYIVWAGANNFSDILGQINANPSYNPSADLAATGADLGNVVSSLAMAGARNILVGNIPDLGIVPEVTGGGAPNLAVSDLVMNFNLGLGGILDGIDLAFPGLNLMRLDTFAMLDQVYMNPAAYGLTNVSDPCYSLYVASGGTTCANPDQYLFWDADHPSSTTHRILATNILHAVPEPESGALLILGLAILAAARTRLAGI